MWSSVKHLQVGGDIVQMDHFFAEIRPQELFYRLRRFPRYHLAAVSIGNLLRGLHRLEGSLQSGEAADSRKCLNDIAFKIHLFFRRLFSQLSYLFGKTDSEIRSLFDKPCHYILTLKPCPPGRHLILPPARLLGQDSLLSADSIRHDSNYGQHYHR